MEENLARGSQTGRASDRSTDQPSMAQAPEAGRPVADVGGHSNPHSGGWRGLTILEMLVTSWSSHILVPEGHMCPSCPSLLQELK